MNMIKAIEDTLDEAKARRYGERDFGDEGVSFEHLVSMLERIQENPELFSEGKIGRWLGYIQGVLVANGCLTLDEVKRINRNRRD